MALPTVRAGCSRNNAQHPYVILAALALEETLVRLHDLNLVPLLSAEITPSKRRVVALKDKFYLVVSILYFIISFLTVLFV
jgi:hypothetical protein